MSQKVNFSKFMSSMVAIYFACDSSIICIITAHNNIHVLLQTETKKEEFRKYLESAGVLDALTKGRHVSK